VVRVGRGNTEGFVPLDNPFLGGSNLTATKAWLLLMVCLMTFGALAANSQSNEPTAEERAAVWEKVPEYQAVFIEVRSGPGPRSAGKATPSSVSAPETPQLPRARALSSSGRVSICPQPALFAQFSQARQVSVE
jgi:hypothetical protein